MPCGGIYPIENEDGTRGRAKYGCWECSKPVHAVHSVEKAPKGTPDDAWPDCELIEWDSFIHSECVPSFLETEEGKIVLHHGHFVGVWKDGKIVVLHEEKG